MALKDVFWMACDSTEQLRAEYGPFHTREEAEAEARKLGFGYLLRYEHILGPNEEIEEVRCIFLELQNQDQDARRTDSIPARRNLSHPLCQLRRDRDPRTLLASRSLGRHPRIRTHPPPSPTLRARPRRRSERNSRLARPRRLKRGNNGSENNSFLVVA